MGADLKMNRLGVFVVSAILLWDGVSKALSGKLYGKVRLEGLPPLSSGWRVHTLGVVEGLVGLALGLWVLRNLSRD